MKTPKYLSPSSISVFDRDRVEFYLRYLADTPPPRMPQTKPMAIGAAFDAYVKSFLVQNLKGSNNDARFALRTIFEAQVEPQNRDWAWEHGKYVFDCYKKSGALADLMLELQEAIEEPKFEFEIEGRLAHETIEGGVPLLGKPDVFFRSKGGLRVVHDWKVNGYCSDSPTSPKKGYVLSRDGWDITKYPATKTHRRQHKDAQILVIDGLHVNCAHNLNDIDQSWADQLAIYGWVLGEAVGSKFIACIEQLAAMGIQHECIPLMRISSYRNRIDATYQKNLFDKIAVIWKTIQDCVKGKSQFFTDLTVEESELRCKTLDLYYLAYSENPDEKERWFQDATRSHDH